MKNLPFLVLKQFLAAIATQTKTKITLGSGVTILDSDSQVRVFERFSTLDAVSNGRAQIILGRGSFAKIIPIVWFDLGDYDAIKKKKSQCFQSCIRRKPIDWQGEFTQSLKQAVSFKNGKWSFGHLGWCRRFWESIVTLTSQ